MHIFDGMRFRDQERRCVCVKDPSCQVNLFHIGFNKRAVIGLDVKRIIQIDLTSINASVKWIPIIKSVKILTQIHNLNTLKSPISS